MEKVCPLCNALLTITEACPQCGMVLLDGGVLSNYLGAYSPYMDAQNLPFQTENHCVHVLYCPTCEYDRRLTLALVTM